MNTANTKQLLAFPFTLWIGSTTTATALSERASKLYKDKYNKKKVSRIQTVNTFLDQTTTNEMQGKKKDYNPLVQWTMESSVFLVHKSVTRKHLTCCVLISTPDHKSVTRKHLTCCVLISTPDNQQPNPG